MKRPRDSQRRRVYRAENTLPGYLTQDRYDDMQALVDFVERIRNARWFVREFGQRHIGVDPGFRMRNARGGKGRITMPPRTRCAMIILHEIAHVVQPLGTPWHGREFCVAYLTLVLHVLGEERHDQLVAAFKAGGVKFRPKRRTGGSGNAEALRRWREGQAAAPTPSEDRAAC